MAKETQSGNGKTMGMNNATAGAVGAAVGGIVGAAAGIALSDKEKRKMLMQKMEDMKKYLSKALEEISQMSEDATTTITEQPVASKRSPKKTAKKKAAN